MVPEKLLEEFVERAKTAAGANLVSLVLYGSVLSPEYHPEHSDLNLLCILREASAQALEPLIPTTDWWVGKKNPMPLIFAKDELLNGTDTFPFDLLPLKGLLLILSG